MVVGRNGRGGLGRPGLGRHEKLSVPFVQGDVPTFQSRLPTCTSGRQSSRLEPRHVPTSNTFRIQNSLAVDMVRIGYSLPAQENFS